MKSLILTIKEANRISILINFLLLFIFLYSYKLRLNLELVKYFLLFVPFTLIIFDKKYQRKPIVWVFITTLLILELIQDYYIAANHHFVLIYLCLIVLIYSLDDNEYIIQHNCRITLILILLFSVIHKLFSFEFVNGTYLSTLGLDGSLFKIFRELDSHNNMILENQEAIASLKSQNPLNYPKVNLLQPFSKYKTFMIVFSYLTIIVEFFIGFLLLVRKNKLLNYILPVFLICLIFTRNETGFIALISLLSIGQLDNKNDNFKIIYFFIFITSLILMLTKNGYF